MESGNVAGAPGHPGVHQTCAFTCLDKHTIYYFFSFTYITPGEALELLRIHCAASYLATLIGTP